MKQMSGVGKAELEAVCSNQSAAGRDRNGPAHARTIRAQELSRYEQRSWSPDHCFRFELIRASGRRAAGTLDEDPMFNEIRLTRWHPDHVDEDLIAVAEVIEALNADRDGLLARESDWCCFCGKALTDPNSRSLGYGPDCAKLYGLPH